MGLGWQKNDIVFTDFRTNVGNSHSAVLEARRCLPRWDPRNRAPAQVPGHINASGHACAPPSFFFEKSFQVRCRSTTYASRRLPTVRVFGFVALQGKEQLS